MISRPIQAHYDRDRRTSTLFFADGSSGEYDMRGALTFPMTVHKGDHFDIEGYAVVGGQDIKSGVITIFEQRPWVTVEHVFSADGTKVEFDGLSAWLNMCWSKYYNIKYYWHQDHETAKRFHLDLIRSATAEPTPVFQELLWTSDEDVKAIIWRAIKVRKMVAEKGTKLQEELQRVKLDAKQDLPAVHALGCLLWGFERYPWREPR